MACIAGFEDMLSNSVLPLVTVASFTTGMVIAVTYMFSQATSNPKLSVWARTEAVQLILSAFSVLMLVMVVDAFCSIKAGEVASLFGLSSDSISLYDAAKGYLSDAAFYSQKALRVVRYHLEAYSVMAALSLFECEFTVGTLGFGCLFGYSGTSLQPMGAFAAHQAALNVFFNSAIMSQLTAMNFLFILLFVYKGFVLFLLPLGVFLRSMPYLRTFGALLLAVSISFLVIYPFILSVYYIMKPVILEEPSGASAFYDESVFADASGAGQSAAAGVVGVDHVRDEYFPSGEKPAMAIQFAAQAFLAAVFLPTAALLATIASVVYMTRLYGEEIDLSRIVQMV